MNPTLCCLSILALVLAEPGPKPGGRLLVSSASSGTVIWHGHRLDPPFRFSVAYTLEPDTVWGQVFINELPLHPKRPPLTGPSLPPDHWLVRRHELGLEVFATARRERDSGRPDAEMLAHIRDLLANATDLVDSARVKGELSIEVFWKGESFPHLFSFGREGEGRAGPPPQIAKCKSITSTLDRKGIVIIGGGLMLGGDVAGFLAECDSLRAGKPIERSSIKDRHAARDIAHPKPIEQLLREGE